MDDEEDIAEVEESKAEEVKGGVASNFHDDDDNDVDNCSVFTRAAAANDDGVFVSFIQLWRSVAARTTS